MLNLRIYGRCMQAHRDFSMSSIGRAWLHPRERNGYAALSHLRHRVSGCRNRSRISLSPICHRRYAGTRACVCRIRNTVPEYRFQFSPRFIAGHAEFARHEERGLANYRLTHFVTVAINDTRATAARVRTHCTNTNGDSCITRTVSPFPHRYPHLR